MTTLSGPHGINTKQKTQGYSLLNGDDKSGHKLSSAMEDGSIVYNCKKN
jgi:hypothetical protein